MFSTIKKTWGQKARKALRIFGGMFQGCVGLTEMKIAENATIIADSCFAECGGLERVFIPEGVERIGHAAFRNCKRLRSLVLPSSLIEVESDAFFNGVLDILVFRQSGENRGLVLTEGTFRGALFGRILLPDDIQLIDKNAFCGCKNLKNITIPVGVEKISSGAFYDCDSLSYARVSRRTKVGPGAFPAQCKVIQY